MRHFSYFLSSVLLLHPFLHATDGTWSAVVSGDWSNGANWVAGNVANTPLPATATFPDTATLTVNVDNGIPGGPTIQRLTFTGSSANIYTFRSTGGGKLNFINNGATAPQIDTTVSLSNPQQFGAVGNPLDVTITTPGAEPLQILLPVNNEYDFVGTISGVGTLLTALNANSVLSLNITGTWSGSISPLLGGAAFGNTGIVKYQKDGAFPTSTLNDFGISLIGSTELQMNATMTPANAFFLQTAPNATDPSKVTQGNGIDVYLNGLSSNNSVAPTVTLDSMTGALFQIQNGTTTYSGHMDGGIASASTDPTAGSRLVIASPAVFTFGGGNPRTFVARTFVASGATLAAEAGTPAGVFGASGSNSALYVRSGGSVIFNGGNTLNKDFRLNGPGVAAAGAIQSMGGTNTILGDVVLGWAGGPEVAAAVTINCPVNLSITGIVSGAQKLTKTGVATLQLFPGAGNNTFTFPPEVQTGILEGNTAGFPTDILVDVGAMVKFTQVSTGTYAQAISGNGSVIKEGAGRLIFSGANTYAGGTMVNTGILEGTTTSLQGGITNNATLSFNQGVSGSFGGVVGGGGTLTIDSSAGASVVTFTNVQTYTGPTIINNNAVNNPTFKMTLANSISTSSGLTVNSGGTFDLNSTNQGVQDLSGAGNITLGTATLSVTPSSPSTTFSGTIGGIGGVTKLGAGTTLNLTGVNTYGGVTTVTAGTLVGNTDSIPANATNNATLIFDQNSSATYAATLSGVGTFRKQGTATLSFNSPQTQGPVFIDTGMLNFIGNPTFTTTGLTVASGASLTGTGTISGPTTVSGTVSPGNSIGTITGSSFSFGAGSTLSIQVDSTLSSEVISTGAFTISPGATLQIVPLAAPAVSQYTIVLGNPVTGTFSNVVVTSPIFTPQVIYFVDHIILSLGSSMPNFNGIILPGNAGRVLPALSALDPFASACLLNLFLSLDITSNATLTSQVNQLQPALFNAFPISEESCTITLRELISQRLDSQRYKCEDVFFCPGQDFWIAPFGNFLHQGKKEGGASVPGFATNSAGIALGYDHPINSTFLIGGSLAYSYSHLSIGNSHNAGGGRGQTNTGYAVFYSSAYKDHFFFDLALTGAINWFSGSRNIEFGSIATTVDAKPHHNNRGYEGAGHVALGFPLGPTGPLCDAWCTPYVMADYIFIHETSYKETHADCLDLAVKAKNSDLLRVEEGFRISSCKIFSCITMVPEVRLAAAEEWRFQGKKTTAHFRVGDVNFTVDGISPNRLLFVPGIGMTTYFFNNQSILSMKLDGEIAHHYWNVKAELEFSQRF